MKRSTKRVVNQGILYVILIALIALLVINADLPSIKENFLDRGGLSFGEDGNWRDLIFTGAKNTIIYTAIAFAGGLTLAFVLAIAKLSPVLPYRWLATAYIEFFRGLPALVVIIFFAYGIPIAFSWRPPGGLAGAGLIALILVAGAYMAETLRAGIQSVPTGQAEAARSLGMSGPRTMVTIVLPQAVRTIIPPLTNELVLLIKDTSLLSVAGATLGSRELTSVARDFQSSGASAQTATSLVQAAILYLIITLPLTQLVAFLERRQRRAR